MKKSRIGDGVVDALELLTSSDTVTRDAEHVIPKLRYIIEICEQTGQTQTAYRCRARLGSTLCEFGRVAEAEEVLRDVVNFREHIDDPNVEASILSSYSLVSQDSGQLQQAKDLAVKVLEIRRRGQDYYALMLSLHNYASLQLALGEFPASLETFNECARIGRMHKLQPYLPRVLSKMARIARNLGQTDKAITYLGEALAIARTMPDEAETLLILAFIGQVYHDIGDHAQGQTYMEEAAEILTRIGAGRRNFQAISPLVYHRPASCSPQTLIKVLHGFRAESVPPNMTLPVNVCILLARVHEDQEDFARAESEVQKALDLLPRYRNETLNIQVPAYAGRFYLRRGELDKAQELLERVVDFGEYGHNWRSRFVAANELSTLHKLRNNYAEAFKYKSKAREIECRYLPLTVGSAQAEIYLHNAMEEAEQKRAKFGSRTAGIAAINRTNKKWPGAPLRRRIPFAGLLARVIRVAKIAGLRDAPRRLR